MYSGFLQKLGIMEVTRGGTKTRVDVVRLDPVQHQWVKKNTDPQKQFDARKEKETFKEERH